MKESIKIPLVIFTDLDATLLDHTTYSYAAAQPMLDFVMENEIPLVFVTSKTEPEVRTLQKRIGICAPFIVENGGAIFIPRRCNRIYKGDNDSEYDVITLGEAYNICVSMLGTLRDDFNLRGFSQMSHDEVAELTGLHISDAAMAKDRHCSEPFVLENPEELDALRAAAASQGFSITKGGRFYHLIGEAQNKGFAVRTLLEHMQNMTGLHYRSIALGDSENDFSMLRSVDIPILIPKADGSYASLELPHLIKAPFSGPKGWNSILKELLDANRT
jgi:mannosyl-3-phosphoglycerate phosphatase